MHEYLFPIIRQSRKICSEICFFKLFRIIKIISIFPPLFPRYSLESNLFDRLYARINSSKSRSTNRFTFPFHRVVIGNTSSSSWSSSWSSSSLCKPAGGDDVHGRELRSGAVQFPAGRERRPLYTRSEISSAATFSLRITDPLV